MSLWSIGALVAVLFAAAYRVYGRFVAEQLGIDDARTTPAVTRNDGVDFVPTSRFVLLAQHFASIAAAGPVVGPITAAIAFGWAPALVWIVLGSIFIGALHDFSSLVAAVRHDARSIPLMVKQHLGSRAYMMSLAFIWLSLLYVIVAFTDVTARQFVAVDTSAEVVRQVGGGVATSSILYLLLSVVFGFATERLRVPLWAATVVAVPLLGVAIVVGQSWPIVLPFADPVAAWGVLILLYCAIASVVPMWALLQPRGYLGGFFLYATLVVGLLGLTVGGFETSYPAFIGLSSERVGPIYPFLFVTIACGACSGFHGLVCSGTTCKQVSRESHMHAVGYGGMLLEGFVAVLALATVMILVPGSSAVSAPPSVIYANGLAAFAERVLGVPMVWGVTFGMLAFATFVYDTLDVATRLGRYLLEELFGLSSLPGRLLATVLTLAMPLGFVIWAPATIEVGGRSVPTWQAVWTVFGSSNQLMAALTLLLLAAWVAADRRKRAPWVRIPAFFMLTTTVVALGFQLYRYATAAVHEGWLSVTGFNALLCGVLAMLGLAFTIEWFRRPERDITADGHHGHIHA